MLIFLSNKIHKKITKKDFLKISTVTCRILTGAKVHCVNLARCHQ